MRAPAPARSPLPTGPAIVGISPLETAVGWPFGMCEDALPKGDTTTLAAASACLERVILERWGDGPCFVAFSGGRDSSAILAVATRVARREGLADPVPVTDIYPGVASADESAWQEGVIRHLKLDSWVRRDASSDADLLGPLTRQLLSRHGVVWPPTIGANLGLWAQAAGGVMFTGEGGDAIFGSHSIATLVRLFHSFPPGPRRLLDAASTLTPAIWRRRSLRVSMTSTLTWLRPEARTLAARAISASEVAEPLHAFRASMSELRARAIAVGLHNMAIIAAERGTTLVHPFVDDRFLGALAPVVARWGFPDRGAMMTALFDDLLPGDILTRRSKAVFNQTNFGEESRRFVAAWDGSGVDTDLIDVEALRRSWGASFVYPGTFMLLQQAWLADRPSERLMS